MTIDPRIPTMPGRSTSGFHQPSRHCLHQARSTVRCSASRMKGGELHPCKNLPRRTSARCCGNGRHLFFLFCSSLRELDNLYITQNTISEKKNLKEQLDEQSPWPASTTCKKIIEQSRLAFLRIQVNDRFRASKSLPRRYANFK